MQSALCYMKLPRPCHLGRVGSASDSTTMQRACLMWLMGSEPRVWVSATPSSAALAATGGIVTRTAQVSDPQRAPVAVLPAVPSSSLLITSSSSSWPESVTTADPAPFLGRCSNRRPEKRKAGSATGDTLYMASHRSSLALAAGRARDAARSHGHAAERAVGPGHHVGAEALPGQRCSRPLPPPMGSAPPACLSRCKLLSL